MNKFTPGPWSVRVDKNDCGDISEKVYAVYHEDNHCLTFICDTGNVKQEIAKANAHLIAAAPELYSALVNIEATLKICSQPYDTENILTLISSALKKARGEV